MLAGKLTSVELAFNSLDFDKSKRIQNHYWQGSPCQSHSRTGV